MFQRASNFFQTYDPTFAEEIGRRFVFAHQFHKQLIIEPADAASNLNGDDYFRLEATAASPTGTFTSRGFNLVTGNTSGDDGIILPHSAAELIGRLGTAAAMTVATPMSITWAIRTGSSVVSLIIAAGGGDNIASTVSTSTNNQDKCLIAYNGSGNWKGYLSRDGVVSITDLGVPVAANTKYRLGIKVGADYKPEYYINGLLVGKATSTYRLLKDDGSTAVGLLPHTFIETSAAATKTYQVCGVYVTREFATS